MMCHRLIQLGGWYLHKRFCTPVDSSNNMSVCQMEELAIHKLERFPNKIEFIQSINMIANDKIGQTPAEFDNVIDNIFKVVFGRNGHKGKKSSCKIQPKTTPTYYRISISGVHLCYSMLQNYSCK